jgi:hypothetical protein
MEIIDMENTNYKAIYKNLDGPHHYVEVTPDGYLVAGNEGVEFETANALVQIIQSGITYRVIEINGSKAIQLHETAMIDALCITDTNLVLNTITFVDITSGFGNRAIQFRMLSDEVFELIDCLMGNSAPLTFVSRCPLPEDDNVVAKALRKWIIREVNGAVSNEDVLSLIEANPTETIPLWVTIKDSASEESISTQLTVNRVLHDEWVACSIAKMDSPSCLDFEYEVLDQAKRCVPNHDILGVFYGRKIVESKDRLTNLIVCSEM